MYPTSTSPFFLSSFAFYRLLKTGQTQPSRTPHPHSHPCLNQVPPAPAQALGRAPAQALAMAVTLSPAAAQTAR